jgi:hypothetical protein
LHAQVTSSSQGNVGAVNLAGRVLTVEQRNAAQECCVAINQPSPTVVSVEHAQVLLEETTPWVLINRPVDDLRREPSILSERISQALLGESARLLEGIQDWSYIRLERDGYLGWIHTGALHKCSPTEVAAYQAEGQARVSAELLPAWLDKSSPGEDPIAGKLPFGVSLPLEKWDSGWALVRLPDGHLWQVERAGLLPQNQLPRPNSDGIVFTLRLMRRFIGIPYLWGGRTPYGFDCSGYTQAFWSFMGVSLPRDADQQYQAGLPIEGPPQPGDLLFFGEADEDHPEERFASISHVAISLGGDEIIHSNGTAWGVSYNSLNPDHAGYRAWLREHLVGVRRFWQNSA